MRLVVSNRSQHRRAVPVAAPRRSCAHARCRLRVRGPGAGFVREHDVCRWRRAWILLRCGRKVAMHIDAHSRRRGQTAGGSERGWSSGDLAGLRGGELTGADCGNGVLAASSDPAFAFASASRNGGTATANGNGNGNGKSSRRGTRSHGLCASQRSAVSSSGRRTIQWLEALLVSILR